jgi:hypothetical protein
MTDPDLHELEVKAMLAEKAEREKYKKQKLAAPVETDIAKFPALTPKELMKLRMAQVSESKVADYFGLTVEQLHVRLSEDEDLKRIFDAAPGRGKAKIQVTQYTTALSGDPTMLKHFGEHNLDQKNTKEVVLSWSTILEQTKKMEDELTRRGINYKPIKEAIDAEFSEVEDSSVPEV